MSPKKPKKPKLHNKNVSELRRDLVTGEWIAIAKGRSKRPKAFIPEGKPEFKEDVSSCPFEDPKASGNAPPVLKYKNKKYSDWSLQVIPNKYPAFSTAGECEDIREEGPYLVRDGYGYHEVVITRDHERHIALMELEEVTQIVRSYKERYLDLQKQDCVKYVSVFHNHGRGAGASLPHPHSQIIAIPVVPADIHRSLRGSNMFFRRNGECVHDHMIAWERKDKQRIVFENDEFIVFCPYVSRAAFEVRVFPKKHEPYFQNTPDKSLPLLAEALHEALSRLNDILDNPDYNFFIHSAPAGEKKYPNYHWHIEIIPKTAIWAGFELGTGIEISTLAPEDAARHLNKAKVKR